MQSVANLQTILNINDDAKRLDQELQITNNKISSIGTDVNARKQDFIALHNKAELTERSSELQQMEDSSNKLQMLENAQNLSARKLDQEIRSMSDRVAVTVCAEDKDFSNHEKILFPYIHTNLGVTDSVISSMKTTGIFKCEKPGRYFISSDIATCTNGTYYLEINGIRYGLYSPNGYYQSGTVVHLILLRKNDTLSIGTVSIGSDSKRVVGNICSCISLLQLTG